MAINSFVPTVWSATLQNSLNDQHIGAAHCNREFEGEISEKGNVVKICGLQNVGIYDYTKNTDMNLPESLGDFSTDLEIDQAKYFNFQIDDIERAQAMPKVMELAMKNAAYRLSNAADQIVFETIARNKPLDYLPPVVTSENVIDEIVKARMELYKDGVTNNDDIYIEISPEIAEYLIKAKIQTLSDNTDVLENGYLGKVAGCKVYVSKNIVQESSEFNGDINVHRCVIRTKRAVAFAEQLSEIQAYRPERRFADAVKGLYLFGCKVIYPNECAMINLGINEF